MYSKYNASCGLRETVTLGGQDYDEIESEIKHPLDDPIDMDYDFIDEDDQNYDFPVTLANSAVDNVYAEVGPYNEVRNDTALSVFTDHMLHVLIRFGPF